MSSVNRHGRITSGIAPDAAALLTLEFIERNLALWRDDPDRPSAERERDLNAQLCKFLNVVARQSDFAMVHFHHEEPQEDRHSADFSANPTEGGWIEGIPYTKYDPILVVEGKRLPTPGSGRQREYVSSGPDKAPAGGLQRFKLGLHGAALSTAGMIGYVQAESCAYWFEAVNVWLEELASSGDPLWPHEETLNSFAFNAVTRVSRCNSEHFRASGASPTIRLTHLWVQMEGGPRLS